MFVFQTDCGLDINESDLLVPFHFGKERYTMEVISETLFGKFNSCKLIKTNQDLSLHFGVYKNVVHFKESSSPWTFKSICILRGH